MAGRIRVVLVQPGVTTRFHIRWIRHFSMVAPLSLYMREKSFSPTPTAEQKETTVCCLKLKTTEAFFFFKSWCRSCAWWHTALLIPLLHSTARTGRTGYSNQKSSLKAACPADIWWLVLNFSRISHVSIYVFTAHKHHYFLFSFATEKTDAARSGGTHTVLCSCRERWEKPPAPPWGCLHPKHQTLGKTSSILLKLTS